MDISKLKSEQENMIIRTTKGDKITIYTDSGEKIGEEIVDKQWPDGSQRRTATDKDGFITGTVIAHSPLEAGYFFPDDKNPNNTRYDLRNLNETQQKMYDMFGGNNSKPNSSHTQKQGYGRI